MYKKTADEREKSTAASGLIQNMSIPKKLALSFVTICASAAIVISIFLVNLISIRHSIDENNVSQLINSKALALETALLRQNSQFRGFLVTGDNSYLKSYDEGKNDYDETSRELERLLIDPGLLAALRKSRHETLAWQIKWGDRLIGEVKAGRAAEAQSQVRAAGKEVLISAAVLPLRAIKEAQKSAIETNLTRQEYAIATATKTLFTGAVALIGIAIALAITLSRTIARPITQLTAVMKDLAHGHNEINVPATTRGDELGEMARAVLVFRDAAVEKETADAANAKADADQKMVVEVISAQLAELAHGNLISGIVYDFPGNYEIVRTNFNKAVASLRTLISSVIEATDRIRSGSNDIAQASENLARRTEANASSLGETVASVTQMDLRLMATATAAGQTLERADDTMITVHSGRTIADEAVQAMTRVAESAKGIDTVIEGLDKIAFQTRVLAMNAAVEAGRAGEAGRGFAVVADLVSALAMRAEEEAGRARDQLTATQSDIASAVQAVQRVDGSLAEISAGVNEVHQLLGSIASDNQAQSSALTQISAALGDMDQATQQNAAMVEETSAAARNLASEVNTLSAQTSRFHVDNKRLHASPKLKLLGSNGKTGATSMV